jgi:DNA-binding PadR family transcriptional regulator
MTVRHALLGLLAQRSRHGYELHAALVALVGGEENWGVRPAQVYTTLARLAESGLIAEEAVEKEGGPEKRIYALLPAGREELEQWLSTGVLDERVRDEFYLKLMLGLAMDTIDSRQLIQVQRHTLYQELHRLTAQRQQADAQSELAKILLLDKAVMHLEADLRWLDMIEARLDDVQRQPLPHPEPKPRGRPPKK